jgi:hypothetical protein
MNPILDAIAAIDSAEPRERLSYRAAGTKFNVNAETLRRRHQGTQLDHARVANNKQLLSPQREIELVQYINELTEQGLPPHKGNDTKLWECCGSMGMFKTLGFKVSLPKLCTPLQQMEHWDGPHSCQGRQ